jgi:hypothetical protein
VFALSNEIPPPEFSKSFISSSVKLEKFFMIRVFLLDLFQKTLE